MSKAFTIVATCHNHLRFLPGMMEMLEAQEFQDFELIIIDNASTDGSKEWLTSFKADYLTFQVVLNPENVGLCKAFNQGVKLGVGKYVIDLSPDDYFTSNKLKQNFEQLEKEKAHVLFSDCEIITTNQVIVHSSKYPFNYQGKESYFVNIVARHCLASCTGVYSREVFENLGGYDESLAYEDFDFMTRVSKKYDLVYDSMVLVKKNEVIKGWSAQFSKRSSPLHESTFRICQKLKEVCCIPDEKQALKKRIKAEQRTQLKLMNLGLVWRYMKLS